MTKSEIRRLVKSTKAQMSREEVERESHLISEVFLSRDFYRDATVIYPYLAYNTEIITNEIIERAWKDGKKVAVPKVLDEGKMEFMIIDSFDSIKEGYCGIPEPDYTVVSEDDKVLIIMPGLAFDRNHNRVGYGGGFYDRYLERRETNVTFLKVALAYDFQIVDNIETEAHDRKVDLIVTKNGVI